MVYQQSTMQSTQRAEETTTSPVAAGIVTVAAIFMIVAGAFHAIQGVAAIIEDEFFIVTENYAYNVDITTWGWIHLFAGLIVALAGGALLSGATWARIVGVLFMVGSAIINFLFIPYYPIWSIIILTVNAIVIWALAFHGGELKDTRS
jgi:hypothetical protein